MKRAKTKTEITIEQHERRTIRLHSQRLVWCQRCAAQVWMLLPEEAALLAQTTARHIFWSVEAGRLHFIETTGGSLFVCRTSLDIIQLR